MPRTQQPLETAARFGAAFGAGPARVGDALAQGLTRSQLRAAVGRGLLLVPRHGILALPGVADVSVPAPAGDEPPTTSTAPIQDRQVHLLAIRAAQRAVGPSAVATHDSAALVLGLPRPYEAAANRVTLARAGIADFDGPGLRVRGSQIPGPFITTVEGIAVTDVRRTAVDLARGRRLPEALIPLDAAARLLVAGWTGAAGNDLRQATGRVDLHHRAARELAYAAAACRGHRGVVRARAALQHVDAASESPLESRSRGWFIEAGVTGLIAGFPVRVGSHTYWADFCEPTSRLIGEADGWSKYGVDLDEIRRTLAAEKTRQAQLESDGWRIVRWTSSDAAASVVSRMQAALRRD